MYFVVKTWVTNWSCHPYPTSSLWWSKMKTTSICPSSRYDDNSFITWSSCYTSRRCSLINDSGWPFESILICIASCYLRTCLHHQVPLSLRAKSMAPWHVARSWAHSLLWQQLSCQVTSCSMLSSISWWCDGKISMHYDAIKWTCNPIMRTTGRSR
jgi:hypothetical protein